MSDFFLKSKAAGLDAVSRRFSWLKRILKVYDDEHAILFPGYWCTEEYLCEKFCLVTKDQLMEICKRDDSSMDVKVLIQAIQATMDFEEKLEKRFPTRVLLKILTLGNL